MIPPDRSESVTYLVTEKKRRNSSKEWGSFFSLSLNQFFQISKKYIFSKKCVKKCELDFFFNEIFQFFFILAKITLSERFWHSRKRRLCFLSIYFLKPPPHRIFSAPHCYPSRESGFKIQNCGLQDLWKFLRGVTSPPDPGLESEQLLSGALQYYKILEALL